MGPYIYDEEASAALRMDVVHEVDDHEPMLVEVWVEAMRRLNSIKDPLARQILTIHHDCGSGTGVCDDVDETDEVARPARWGCETTEAIANHFGLAFPLPPQR